jgi:hypothetical protein
VGQSLIYFTQYGKITCHACGAHNECRLKVLLYKAQKNSIIYEDRRERVNITSLEIPTAV